MNYVLSKITQYHFGRGEPPLRFRNYQDFVNTQVNLINGFNERSVQAMEFLRDQIVPRSRIFDEESQIDFSNHGFVFDREGKVVFIMPR